MFCGGPSESLCRTRRDGCTSRLGCAAPSVDRDRGQGRSREKKRDNAGKKKYMELSTVLLESLDSHWRLLRMAKMVEANRRVG